MRIDRIRMVVPSQLGPHAQKIASAVASNLAASAPHRPGQISYLAVPTIRIDASVGATGIPDRVTTAILDQLRDHHG